MKFKILLTDKTDPTKSTEEDTVAKNEAELRQLYSVMYPNFDLKVLQQLGEPEKKVADIMSTEKGEPSVPNQIPTPRPPPTFQKPPVMEFEDNGVKYKIENSVVFKKTWVTVDNKDYRIVTKNGNESEAKGLKIEKLDWVKVNEEKKK